VDFFIALAGVFLLVLLGSYCVAIVYFLIQILWRTLPALGAAVVVYFGLLWAFSTQRLRSLNPHSAFARSVPITFSSTKMKWQLSLARPIESYRYAGLATASIGFVSGVACWIVLAALYHRGVFEGVRWTFSLYIPTVHLSPVSSFICGGVLCLSAVCALSYFGYRRLEHCTVTWARYLVKHLNACLQGVDELRCLESSVETVAGRLGINFPADYTRCVAEFANTHRAELLADTRGKLKELIDRVTVQAKQDLRELQRAEQVLHDLRRAYEETVPIVNASGSITIIKEMDLVYEAMQPEILGSLLVEKDWATFHSAVQDLTNEIMNLREVAYKYQRAAQEEHTTTNDDVAEQSMTEEKAYAILGVVPPVRGEKLEKVYRALIQACHADHKLSEEDKKRANARVRELNAARAFLKKIGKWS